MFELLTGEPPFSPPTAGNTHDAVRAGIERAPRMPTRVNPALALPSGVDDAILWALAVEPAARYGSVESFAKVFRSSLGETLADEPIADARRPTLLETQPRVVARGGVSPAAVSVPARLSPRRPDLSARLTGPGRNFWRLPRDLPSLLWRAVGLVAVLDLVVALILLLNQGRVPGLYEPVASLHAGGSARVVAATLEIRADPGDDGQVIGQLNRGAVLHLTGPANALDGQTWWPVATTPDGAPIAGYAAAEALRPEPESIGERLRKVIPDGE